MAQQEFSLLMVEDDIKARDAILRMITLKFPQCTTYAAGNGREGLDLFRQHAPDLVLSDINMPEMNGVEMARAIREFDAEARFIILTGYSTASFKASFSEIGCCAYLLKPIVLKELIAAIETCSTDVRR